MPNLKSYQRVKEFFRDNPGEFSVNWIRDKTNIDYLSIKIICKELIKEGFLVKVTNGNKFKLNEVTK